MPHAPVLKAEAADPMETEGVVDLVVVVAGPGEEDSEDIKLSGRRI
jgi:hypothetical protein